ncbi:precorrin-2 C(20)-methyltransferase [Limoniibacter endophyticus]|uniref:Precorrin-2 C(20)-methyltransferase n=1 Tax=Limoniibacter endophyticus TaxID=1565040 RepID=A0A8J3GIN0_9HYPH|nr:precorrin-2 C(20)-methyltransferase [Limoniibacter endophyticus]GHC78452.1 precorrin-2 C(20)-methyltransferase [Limoniibacter endophyticus]
MSKKGTLYGVGTGPGDPELLTLKAVRVLREADVLAYFCKEGRRGNARAIVDTHIGEDMIELALPYPVTTEIDAKHDDYRAAIDAFYERSARAVMEHLDQGRSVAVLSEGDPLLYGSYMHLHVRLAHRYPALVIPGVTAMSGSWSMAGLPLVQGDEILRVLPGTLPLDRLTKEIAEADGAVIMKVGRNLSKIEEALAACGKLDTAVYVERATMENAVVEKLDSRNGRPAPYFSTILVPGWPARPLEMPS